MDGVPDGVLEDVAYIARSSNRVSLLQALVSAPAASRDLRVRTGISKTTCNRILNEFDERSWVRQRPDGTYEATARAEHVAAQFRPFVDSVATLRDLGDVASVVPVDDLAWGPDDELTLGLHHFDDATVKRKPPQQKGVGRAELVEAYRATTTIHTVCDGAPPRVIGEALQERADQGGLSGAGVFSVDLFEYLRDHHEGPPDWSDVIAAGVPAYRYDGATPNNITVTDDSTFIFEETSDGTMTVVISESDAVRQWGIDVVERYRDGGERVDPAVFD